MIVFPATFCGIFLPWLLRKCLPSRYLVETRPLIDSDQHTSEPPDISSGWIQTLFLVDVLYQYLRPSGVLCSVHVPSIFAVYVLVNNVHDDAGKSVVEVYGPLVIFSYRLLVGRSISASLAYSKSQ